MTKAMKLLIIAGLLIFASQLFCGFFSSAYSVITDSYSWEGPSAIQLMKWYAGGGVFIPWGIVVVILLSYALIFER